ncbi:MAG: hypothetical protein M5R36_10360 [Deltaproteobacteria bacterium]|nr:hypothetical protein [Deltaproteobacteria bacterium]
MNLFSAGTMIFLAALYVVFRWAVPARWRPAFLSLTALYFLVAQSSPAFPINLLYAAITIAVVVIGLRYGKIIVAAPDDEKKKSSREPSWRRPRRSSFLS